MVARTTRIKGCAHFVSQSNVVLDFAQYQSVRILLVRKTWGDRGVDLDSSSGHHEELWMKYGNNFSDKIYLLSVRTPLVWMIWGYRKADTDAASEDGKGR